MATTPSWMIPGFPSSQVGMWLGLVALAILIFLVVVWIAERWPGRGDF